MCVCVCVCVCVCSCMCVCVCACVCVFGQDRAAHLSVWPPGRRLEMESKSELRGEAERRGLKRSEGEEMKERSVLRERGHLVDALEVDEVPPERVFKHSRPPGGFLMSCSGGWVCGSDQSWEQMWRGLWIYARGCVEVLRLQNATLKWWHTLWLVGSQPKTELMSFLVLCW